MVEALPDHIYQLTDEILSVRLSDLKREAELCRVLLETSETEGCTYGVAFAYTYLADCTIALGDLLSCSSYLKEALKLAEHFHFQTLLIRIYHLFGMFYTTAFDGQTALEYYHKELMLANEFEDIEAKFGAYNNIGNIFLYQSAYSDAKEYFDLACDVLGEQGSGVYTPNLSIALMNLCYLSLEAGDLEAAEVYLERCEQLPKKDLPGGIRCLVQFGRVILAGYLPETDGSMNDVDRLLDMQSQISDRTLLYDTSVYLCQMLLQRGDQLRLERTLHLMESIHHEGSVKRTLELRTLWVDFYERFHMEKELQEAYKAFYLATKETEAAAKQDRADGLRSKLHLLRALDEQSSMREENDNLTYLAGIDELTGLLNRRQLNRMAGQTLKEHSVENLGAVMVDIDFFKEYNDCYGHLAGDTVIKEVADCLASASTQIYPCRFGGDEFLSLCINCTDEEILAYISRVQAALEEKNIPHAHSSVSSRLTLSIGCTNMRKSDGFDWDKVLRLADAALYKAKQAGRNTYRANM